MPRRSATSKSGKTKSAIIGAKLERCIFCQGTRIVRKGRRRKKLETVQLWLCNDCERVFTPQRAKGKTYPLKLILESLILYYRGEPRARVVKRIKERFGVAVPLRTLSSWIAEYRDLTTYTRMRAQCMVAFRPTRIIRSVRLHHQQVYRYAIHQGKLNALLDRPGNADMYPIGDYLTEMAEDCPHSLFQTDVRASQSKVAFDLDAVEIKARRNHACRITDLVIQTVTHNRRRHDEVQRFMLATDSATVAVEVPVYLSPADIRHFRKALGFNVPIETAETLTGHIDVIQIRNGAIHILDYKPGAKREKPIVQLMVYALALSRRTGLRLYDFVCAWFDERHYYEFYPLQVVHKRKRRMRGAKGARSPGSAN